MPEAHLRQPGFTLLLANDLLKTKKEFKDLKKKEIQDIFWKRTSKRLFSTWYGLCRF